MLHKSVLTFRIPAKPTRLDYYWLHLLHTISLIASIFNGLPVGVKIVLVLFLSINWILSIRRYRTISIQYIEIELRNADQWSLREQGGEQYNATLMATTVNTAYCVFLHLDLGSAGKRYLMLSRNKIEPEKFRQLRVALTISSSSSKH